MKERGRRCLSSNTTLGCWASISHVLRGFVRVVRASSFVCSLSSTCCEMMNHNEEVYLSLLHVSIIRSRRATTNLKIEKKRTKNDRRSNDENQISLKKKSFHARYGMSVTACDTWLYISLLPLTPYLQLPQSMCRLRKKTQPAVGGLLLRSQHTHTYQQTACVEGKSTWSGILVWGEESRCGSDRGRKTKGSCEPTAASVPAGERRGLLLWARLAPSSLVAVVVV